MTECDSVVIIIIIIIIIMTEYDYSVLESVR